MTYESELSALTTAFLQRQQRFPNFSEKASLEEAARDTVYRTPKGCGHQLTESEFEYYENRRHLPRLCKGCVLEGRAR